MSLTSILPLTTATSLTNFNHPFAKSYAPLLVLALFRPALMEGSPLPALGVSTELGGVGRKVQKLCQASLAYPNLQAQLARLSGSQAQMKEKNLFFERLYRFKYQTQFFQKTQAQATKPGPKARLLEIKQMFSRTALAQETKTKKKNKKTKKNKHNKKNF